jgi:hypothetical protein
VKPVIMVLNAKHNVQFLIVQQDVHYQTFAQNVIVDTLVKIAKTSNVKLATVKLDVLYLIHVIHVIQVGTE